MSANVEAAAHAAGPANVMWAKNSRSDFTTVTPASFNDLRLDEIRICAMDRASPTPQRSAIRGAT